MPLLSSPENAGDPVARLSAAASLHLLLYSIPQAIMKWLLVIAILLPMLAQAQVPPPKAEAGKDKNITLPIN
ncbi:MAG TPA: hypothetical protein VFF90_13585, partial [Saprospiraceae bacterium]|nr:hypothetical protein [Saprospiraceae bacterium]